MVKGQGHQEQKLAVHSHLQRAQSILSLSGVISVACMQSMFSETSLALVRLYFDDLMMVMIMTAK